MARAITIRYLKPRVILRPVPFSSLPIPSRPLWHEFARPARWPDGLPCSASRVAGEISALGRSRIRPCGLTAASHPGPGLPVSRARHSPAAAPDCALVCFVLWPKRSRRSIRRALRPVASLACSRRANLASNHTHMSAEAYPPDGPRIRPRQGSQNFSERAVGVAASVQCAAARLWSVRRLENFCARQAGGSAVPDPASFGNQTYGHATTLPWCANSRTSGETKWLTTKRTPTKSSSFTA